MKTKPRKTTEPADGPDGSGRPQLSCEQLLEQLERCAAECARVQSVLGGRGVPELETIIKLHRLLILRFSLEAETAPESLKLVEALMKPVMDWARLEEKRKERELAEEKYREQVEAGKAARAAGTSGGGEALRPETLEKIHEELSLL